MTVVVGLPTSVITVLVGLSPGDATIEKYDDIDGALSVCPDEMNAVVTMYVVDGANSDTPDDRCAVSTT